MRVVDSESIRSVIDLRRLIDCLEEAFCQDYHVPARQIVDVPGGGDSQRLLLNMIAFDARGAGAVKLSTVYADNPERSLPRIQSVIVMFSETGTPTAVLDGALVTHMRTGAASALASKFLSRPDSAHLVMIGTGALSPFMIAAHCAIRPISRVSVVGRQTERSLAVAAAARKLLDRHIEIEAAESVEEAVRNADIISCATASATPVFEGKWLKAGTFVDLVGSFSPANREADDETISRSRLFVDTLEGALKEAGDLIQPLTSGAISRERIEGELADLARGRVRGRSNADEVILFKSVGTPVEDLAAARMIMATALGRGSGS